jgi:threonine/homoserine/homoserine lactone efflux protein
MLQAFINGCFSGFVMSLMLGTVFFALIQHSVDYGFKTGLYISTGVIISDVIFILIAVSGSSLVPSIQSNEDILRAAGAVVLFILGIVTFRKKIPVAFPEAKAGTIFFFISKGFLLNVVNPVNFFAWLSLGTYLKGALHYNSSQTTAYFIACLMAIFLTEALIALASSRLRKVLTEQLLTWVNRGAGLVFMMAAIAIVWPVLKKISEA